MLNITSKQQKILLALMKKSPQSSSQVYSELGVLGEKVSLVTVKRALSEMLARKLLKISGSGRSTAYTISTAGRVFFDIDAGSYCAVDPDKRFGQSGYNFGLFKNFPNLIFTEKESAVLEAATEEYRKRIKDLPESIRKKELERLIIELSWKSSKIEGNTYTLLDTEKLILENRSAPGKTKEETRMILNHKDAFEFVRQNKTLFKKPNRAVIEELHKVLIRGLGVGFNLRQKPVGITGAIYRPLDNGFQIAEALNDLTNRIIDLDSPYAKALLAILGIAYIQPFEDGNKRTGRLLANAVLLAYGLAPLSYRSIDEKEYREATLIFYELNSITPLKKIFISQYDFAARNYAVK